MFEEEKCNLLDPRRADHIARTFGRQAELANVSVKRTHADIKTVMHDLGKCWFIIF